MQASNANNTGVNVREENNSTLNWSEEEGNKNGEDGGTKIDTVQEGILKDLKDFELELSNVRKSTMVNNGPLKWKAIEEQFGPISKSPLKFVDRDSSRFEDQIQRTTLASRSLFDNSKTPTNRVPLTSSTGLVFLSKTMHRRIKELDVDSESDGNLPLAVAIVRKHSGVPPRHNHRSMEKRMDKEIPGGKKHLASSAREIWPNCEWQP